MGRGAEGGCGTEESSCRVHKATPIARKTTTAIAERTSTTDAKRGMDAFVQARKALSERSPFEPEEALARVPTLPVGLAQFLAKFWSESNRRKNRKLQNRGLLHEAAAPPSSVAKLSKAGSHGSASASASASASSSSLWVDTEDYFRQVTLDDIDSLTPQTRLSLKDPDPCFSLVPPVLRRSGEALVLEENVNSSFLSPHVSEERESASSLSVEDREDAGYLSGRMLEEMKPVTHLSPHILEEIVAASKMEEEKKKGNPNCGISLMEVDTNSPEFSGNKEKKEKHDDVALTSSEEGKVSLSTPAPTEPTIAAVRVVESRDMEQLLSMKQKSLSLKRPAKKRKLVVTSADETERIAVSPVVKGDSAICHVCSGKTSEETNKILACDDCGVSVHQKCYGVQDISSGEWLCSWCSHILQRKNTDGSTNQGAQLSSKPCLFCPNGRGALKPLANDGDSENGNSVKFAHLFCCQWAPEFYVENTRTMEPIRCTDRKKESQKKLSCCLCKEKFGTCIQCSHGMCKTSFHPLCAREARYRMEIWRKTRGGNVELWAFCSKHSSQDFVALQAENNLFDAGSNSSVAKFLPENRLQKSKTERKLKAVKRKGGLQDGIPTASSDKASICPYSSRDLARNNLGDIDVSDSHNLVLSFKKLINHINISLKDVASEMGVSSDSLAALLQGENGALYPVLEMKVFDWLCKMGSTVQSSNVEGDPAVSTRAKKKGREILIDEMGENPSVDSINIQEAVNLPNCADQGCNFEEVGVTGKKIHLAEFAGNSEQTTLSSGCSLGIQDVVEETLQSPDQAKPCLAQESDQANAAVDVLFHPPKEKAELLQSGALDMQGLAKPMDETNIKVNELSIGSFMHPLIHERLMRIENCSVGRQRNRSQSDGECWNGTSSWATASNGNELPSCSITSEVKHIPDVAQLKQLVKARKMGIMDLAPDDEVEGEILYFQNQLLASALACMNSCDDLIFRVVTNLPHEQDALRRQRWDAVVVNQYLCEVREAKKQGRKEKRFREAQAVLAAATAAAAASSRVSSSRKDSYDEVSAVHGHSVSPFRGSALSGRPGSYSQLIPVKETLSRLVVTKASCEKQSDVCQLASDSLKDRSISCDICCRNETISNRLAVCCNCKVAVHPDCYHILRDSGAAWHCEPCEELIQHYKCSSRIASVNVREWQCGLCGGTSGALRKSTDGQWVHAFCAEWILESTFQRGQPNPVEGMQFVLKERDAQLCSLCRRKVGVFLKCSYGHCHITFHPLCARNSGLYMTAKTSGGKVQHRAYCEKHTMERKEKVESQPYGSDELKSIKQIRVELERVRLLCERIVRREKLKRELVLCSHDILASKRDCVAFSVLFHSSFLLPDVSSGSVTTSLKGHTEDNKSCGETIQRSDEITVDSAVSSKFKDASNVQSNIDLRGVNSSTSHRTCTRKSAERLPVAGKHLPNQSISASMEFRSPRDDGDRKLKSRKHMETLQREVVMTPTEASMQNQRLPKGYAYVPMVCLSKGKPASPDTELHDA
ncbi:hypothetical protein AMTR_s00173p00060580 [Amborella trichopoda]|uniref:PHD-type domain-containing protein n=2 Tax=Amborella trichopoda TaxID=13333 RepID=W1NPC3_AMBTC|nr:hypothetical protein AMTR_s00173p00060580 [Amborella trichopoda]